MSAGSLRERIAFDKRQAIDDGAGNTEGDFVEQFIVWARVVPLKGGEQVMAQRLEGQQPVTIRVRYSTQTAAITAAWRARNAATGTVYAITAPPANMDERKAYLDILASTGRAA